MFFPSPRQAYVSYSATSNKKLLGAPGIATRNKKLLGAPGLTTRSKDATNGAPHICAAYVFVGSSGHSALFIRRSSCLACAGCYAYFTTASDNVEPRPVELRKGEARGSKEEVA